MSDTCPTIDQARVKQVQDAFKILFEKKGPEDESNSIGNLLGCMSGELSNALSPLEDLDTADTSIPKNVDEETVAATQSIFSEMFRENIGNSENEKDFVSFAMKMVFAITNHLENSSGNQFKTDPRVEELNGGMPRTNSSKKRSQAKQEPEPESEPEQEPKPTPEPDPESVLANETGALITTFLINNGVRVGALLTNNMSDQEKILKDYVLPTQDSLINAAHLTGEVAKIPVKYYDIHVNQPINKTITETKYRALIYAYDKIDSIINSPYFQAAFHIIMTIVSICFLYTSFVNYILGIKNFCLISSEGAETFVGLYNESATVGPTKFILKTMNSIISYIPSLYSPKAAAVCGINFDGYENTLNTIAKNAGPGIRHTFQCVKDVHLEELKTHFYRDIANGTCAGPYICYYWIRPGIYKIYESFFKKKELQEQEQSAGKSKSRRRKAKKAKKKTRKNHKKNTRKNRKKSKRYTKKH